MSAHFKMDTFILRTFLEIIMQAILLDALKSFSDPASDSQI